MGGQQILIFEDTYRKTARGERKGRPSLLAALQSETTAGLMSGPQDVPASSPDKFHPANERLGGQAQATSTTLTPQTTRNHSFPSSTNQASFGNALNQPTQQLNIILARAARMHCT